MFQPCALPAGDLKEKHELSVNIIVSAAPCSRGDTIFLLCACVCVCKMAAEEEEEEEEGFLSSGMLLLMLMLFLRV